MKTLFVIVLATILQSCNLLNSEPEKNVSIKTESESITVNDRLSVKTTFTNNLGKEISVMNAGCNFPDFTLERLMNNKWTIVGFPICVAIAVAPTKVENGKSYDATVSMYAENYLVSGTYRMKFSIRDKDYGESIDERYLYSNQFKIVRQ